MLSVFTACQESGNSRPYVMNEDKNGVNQRSLAFQTQDKALDRKNKLEMAEIVAKSKLEVAKIESNKAVQIATIDSVTKKDMAKQSATTTLEISKIESTTKDKESMTNLYIALGAILAILIAMFLWYANKKKSLELQARMEENRLKHEFSMKEKELQESRIQKVLDLAISGQLPQEVQQDFIRSLTNQDTKLINKK